jgi:hypothetical protein
MSMDSFFNWGNRELGQEIEDDIVLGLLQPKRSLFYSRSYGAGINMLENTPASITLQILGRYEVAKFMGYRNSVVTNGQNGLPDRRAVASQGSIDISVDRAGQVDFTVNYIPLYDYQSQKSVGLPVGIAR